VTSLHTVGHGIPDLLVGIAGIETHLVEVKDGAKAPSAQMLTKDQVAFIEQWRGAPVVILRDVEIARTWARRLREKHEMESR
jgi:hypothetical protein